MRLFGKNYSKTALRKRLGNMDQLAGIRLVSFDDGNERPVRAALFHTGSGLEFTVLLDRGMDIASASFQGKAMGWRSTTGNVAPQYFEPEGLRWLRSYFGGLVTTCGLTRVGAPGADSALQGDGLHGRISHIPARDIQVSQAWEGDRYLLSVSGVMRETSVFGENLTLRRTISTELGASSFRIRDVVCNEGFTRTGLSLLYHCNIGWPVLDQGSRMIAPVRALAPRDSAAEKGMETWDVMDAPTHGYREKCYYHDMIPDKKGEVTVALVNDGFPDNGFGVYIRYNKKELPRFVQWKQMGEQVYVCGLEPCNCGIEGREKDEALGLLDMLNAGEERAFNLEFGVLTDGGQVAALQQTMAKNKPQFKKSYTELL
ncbi:MAG TPA: aldose 1-epimerase family protein [Candidatus Hydrogenedentes bacterium]|jgi:hypothetical protein|nr:aldose 1-epimerase family protein [Candidatus Hydrogenedentota bacterium]HPX87169.1 aldose 1-epimerase family protein [Candidatus Hydrogenedentota bacterium]HQB03234.1 aldose 1-epimerase family protein [Candidatus Hydrogenedentota bacterium]